MKTQEEVKSKWSQLMQESLQETLSDPDHEALSPREKLLAFYYTHFEYLGEHREFVLARFRKSLVDKILSRELTDYRKQFQRFTSSIIQEAVERKALQNLGIANQSYASIIWGQLLFLVRYWITDTSPDFIRTEELIEKSVASMFDLSGKKEYRSTVEFGKFIVQNPMKFSW